MVKIERQCQYCAKTSTTKESRIKTGRGKFCSRKCADLSKVGIRESSKKVEQQCLYCSKIFLVLPSTIESGKGKFCSKFCYSNYQIGKRSPTWDRVKLICSQCGKSIYKIRSQIKKSNFCSRKCYWENKKGKSMSTEQKEKISVRIKAKFGGKVPPWLNTTETIAKRAKTLTGRPSPRKGIKMTYEQLQEFSRSKKARKKLEEIIKLKQGKLLSGYFGINKPIKLLCREGHEFVNTPSHIRSRGQWCPICSTGINERYCRELFKLIFHEEFPKIRPLWLIGSKGKRLELDGYCKKLGIAFEYQGRQHYEEHELFSRGSSFEKRKEIDKLKRELCLKNGVILIEVPYTISVEEMPSYIITECNKKGIQVQNAIIDLKNVNVNYPEKLNEIQEIANSREGVCLSTKYISVTTKMRFRCKVAHEWETKPQVIKRGKWCPYCGHSVKLTLQEFQEISKQKGGLCLSTEYVNQNTKLRFRCKKGHEWEGLPTNIKGGKWCLKCSGYAKLTIEDMQRLAESRSGKCLSSKYRSARDKLKWQCKQGHTWDAIPSNIKRGHWCAICARKNRKVVSA